MLRNIAFGLLFFLLVVDTVVGDAKIELLQEKNISIATWISPKEIANKFPYYISGFDHENRPMELGKWDMRSAAEEGGSKLENLQLHVDQFFYRLGQAGKSLKNGDEFGADTSAVIIDWENYSLTQFASSPTIQFVLKNFAGFQKIQDVLAYGFFVNANSIATTLINLARPIIGSFMERVEVHGTKKDRWVPQLLRKMHQSQIPPWYGGKEDFTPVITYG